MINERVTNSGKNILDILEEFYRENTSNIQLIDRLIDAFQLEAGAQSAFLADNAQLINSLVGARQKSSQGLLDLLNVVQKFQANEIASEDDGMEGLKDLMHQQNEDDSEDVEDLLGDIAKNNKDNPEVMDVLKRMGRGDTSEES